MKNGTSYRLLGLMVCIHVLYFIAAIYFKGIYLIDSYGYLMQADNMRACGTWYAEDWNTPLLIDYFSIRPPFYASFINIVRVFTTNIFAILFIQNCLSVLNCWLVYRFAVAQKLSQQTTAIIIVTALVFYPAQMIHANFVMTEILFQTIVLGIFLTLFSFVKEPSWKTTIVLSVLLSIGLVTKPISLFLPLIVGSIMVWSIYTTKSNWQFVIPLVVVLFTFNGVCLQNKHATGYYHYSSIKSINQLKYNARYTLVNAKGELYADSSISAIMQQANQLQNYGERLEWMNTQASHIIMEYPLAFAEVYVKGFVAFFLDPGRFDVYHFFAIEEKETVGLMYEIQTKGMVAIIEFVRNAPILILLLLALNFCWNVCVVAAFIYFIFSRQILWQLRMILLVLVLYVAAATGPVGVSRYRVPVYPLLLVGVLFAGNQLALSKRQEHA